MQKRHRRGLGQGWATKGALIRGFRRQPPVIKSRFLEHGYNDEADNMKIWKMITHRGKGCYSGRKADRWKRWLQGRDRLYGSTVFRRPHFQKSPWYP